MSSEKTRIHPLARERADTEKRKRKKDSPHGNAEDDALTLTDTPTLTYCLLHLFITVYVYSKRHPICTHMRDTGRVHSVLQKESICSAGTKVSVGRDTKNVSRETFSGDRYESYI